MANKQKYAPLVRLHSPALKRTLDVIVSLPSVERIVLGASKGTRHSRPVGSVKLQEIVPHGVKMVGYGDRGIISFFVVTSTPEKAQQEIATKLGL